MTPLSPSAHCLEFAHRSRSIRGRPGNRSTIIVGKDIVMTKHLLVTLASAATLAAAATPAFADSGLGFDPYYVENPNGSEVAQTHRSATTALGYDAWYVSGQVERNTTATAGADRKPATRAQRLVRERQPQKDHAYSVPAFGPQADA
jgi:hypothetical protein